MLISRLQFRRQGQRLSVQDQQLYAILQSLSRVDQTFKEYRPVFEIIQNSSFFLQILQQPGQKELDMTKSSDKILVWPSDKEKSDIQAGALEGGSRSVQALPLVRHRPPVATRSAKFVTPVGTVEVCTSITKRSTTNGTGHEVIDKDISYTIRPNRLLQMFGMSYGLFLNAKSTSGWQYMIQPFRTVSEKSLIFEFCRNGNLSGLQTLLDLGDGSLRDRDTMGRTPLWVSI